MSLYSKPSSSSSASFPTEFDILKASHKFLREDQDAVETQNTSWNDQLAQKYYDSLFREFAVCDLKHYKSGNVCISEVSSSRYTDTLCVCVAQFALRWRTEAEVLSGAGENTCGNTRCKHHNDQDAAVKSSILELPFAYEEHGEHKSALVKVVLCPRCLKKLMWKRNKERTADQPATQLDGPVEPDGDKDIEGGVDNTNRLRRSKGSLSDGCESTMVEMKTGPSIRRRTSRSRSPRNRKDNHRSRRRRSTSPQP